MYPHQLYNMKKELNEIANWMNYKLPESQTCFLYAPYWQNTWIQITKVILKYLRVENPMSENRLEILYDF